MMIIRRPSPSEHPAIRALIGSVATEIYESLWDKSSRLPGDEDWSRSWIAVDGKEPIGVLLTTDEWIDDLWISRAQRGQGFGARLLCLGEAEIAGRKLDVARLRVVKTNIRAISFYVDHGWQIEKEFQHEHLPVTMLQLRKRLNPLGFAATTSSKDIGL